MSHVSCGVLIAGDNGHKPPPVHPPRPRSAPLPSRTSTSRPIMPPAKTGPRLCQTSSETRCPAGSVRSSLPKSKQKEKRPLTDGNNVISLLDTGTHLNLGIMGAPLLSAKWLLIGLTNPTFSFKRIFSFTSQQRPSFPVHLLHRGSCSGNWRDRRGSVQTDRLGSSLPKSKYFHAAKKIQTDSVDCRNAQQWRLSVSRHRRSTGPGPPTTAPLVFPCVFQSAPETGCRYRAGGVAGWIASGAPAYPRRARRATCLLRVSSAD